MGVDATDQSFEADVLARSEEVPVVVDLWAPWCGPCRTLGPIIERAVAATGGKVELAKVNVDENPEVSAAFRVQSIPAVFAVDKRKVVDSFVGALPEKAVEDFVGRLIAAPSEADMLAATGDEASLRRALEIEPGHAVAVVALAELLVGRGQPDEALSLLARIPETGETRRVAALARLAAADGASARAVLGGTVEERLAGGATVEAAQPPPDPG
jgi:putative thioredoxin